MAAYTDHHQAFHDNWGRSDLPSDHEDPQGVSMSEILNHGSVSFGKYAAESLAWEKWSVFSHNRAQEELEKFNGLVAQKKAYFEEYYRRIRALKKAEAEAEALEAAEAEAQTQETTPHLESYQDDLTATSSAEESIDDTGSKEEKQSSAVTGIQLLDAETFDLHLSAESIENNLEKVAEHQRSYSSSSNGKASVGNEVDISMSAIDLAPSPKAASPEPVSWHNGSSEAAQQSDLVSDIDMVDLNSRKKEGQVPVSKTKDTVASARDRAELDDRAREDARKQSERQKSTSQKKLAGNAHDKVQPSRKTTPKPAGNMRPNSASSHRLLLPGNADDKLQHNRKATPKPAGNVRPNSASSHRSLISETADDKLRRSRKTTPKPAGNMNSASSNRLPTEVPTRASVPRSSIALDKSVSSVSSIRSVQTNISLNPKALPQKATSRFPVNTLSHSSVQSTPKEITIKGGMRNVATENRSARTEFARKALDITSHNMTPKGRRSENQRPKPMSTTLPTHSKSNQDGGIEHLHGSYDTELQKKGKDQTNAGQRRYPKRPLSNAPGVHKPPSPRPKKITPSQSRELMRNQRVPREARPKTPCWR